MSHHAASRSIMRLSNFHSFFRIFWVVFVQHHASPYIIVHSHAPSRDLLVILFFSFLQDAHPWYAMQHHGAPSRFMRAQETSKETLSWNISCITMRFSRASPWDFSWVSISRGASCTTMAVHEVVHEVPWCTMVFHERSWWCMVHHWGPVTYYPYGDSSCNSMVVLHVLLHEVPLGFIKKKFMNHHITELHAAVHAVPCSPIDYHKIFHDVTQ